MIPPLEPLHLVVQTLHSAGIEVALGGSGLLCSLGLVDSVRDWDLTTDATLDQVSAALGAIPWQRVTHGDQSYGTDYRINITPNGADIDLMGRFSVYTDAGLCHIPTVVTGTWNGVPVGSPEAWAVAYDLIGRPAKAEMLNTYLRNHGVRSEIQALLLKEPLSESLKRMVSGW